MSVAQKHGLGILPKAIRTAAWATIGLLVIFCLFLGINAGGGASSAFAATPDTSAAISATTTTDGTSDSLASSTPTTPTAPTNTSGASVATGATGQDVSILFTHDMHSHFDPERYMLDGQVAERGGLARLKTAIDNAEVSSPDSFLLDAGDFSMGTSYQTIFSSEAAELRIMGQMGYDATTLGNHEFDYRTQGLTDMLNAAVDSGDKLPALTADNIDWDATLADPALQADGQALENALARYGNADYVIIDRGGVKMAVFGIIGKSAIADAPLAGVDFKDPIETAKAMVAKIKAEANPDIIVCLSHSGTNPDPSKSEDELLAKAVPDIDVIISGHTHTVLEQPIVVGHTYIVSCGSYTDYLGQITLTRAGDRWQMGSYQLTPIDQGLALDQATETAILGFRSLVDERYFSKFGYQSDEVLANSPFSFTPIDQFGINQGEDTLGNLITDSYIYAVQKAEGSAYQKVDVAIVPNGIIRGSFAQGNITVADAYNVLSLGIGPDNVPGYPLVSIYLTGKELKTAAEVDISVSPMMTDARLYMSGLSYTYNPHRLILNRVTDVSLMAPDGTLTPLDDNKLYRVVGDLYSCQMLGEVQSRSYGLLKIVPKDADGNPIVNYEDHIIQTNGMELKDWAALASYLASFESVNGVPQVPAYYNQLQNRKIEVDSKSLVELLKSPNKVFFILVGAVVVVLAIIAAVIVLVVRLVRRGRRRRLAREAAGGGDAGGAGGGGRR